MSYNFDSEQYDYDVFSDSRNTNYSRRPQYNRKRKIRKRTRNRIMICTVGVCIILSVVLLLGGCFYGIVGPTDVMIYPNGADIAGVGEYDSYNEKFNHLSEQGIRIYCNVDSSQYWMQKGDNYFRMGRRNLDGYRMYHDADLLTDLFDAKTIIDPKRPTPVPTMEEVYGS